MAIDEYASVYLLGIWNFNFLFVTEWALGIIAALFMLFYWNRMIGSILSLSIRWYFWHYHKSLVKVQSFQISILAGRLFFKNFTYVGSNESITILQGSFTWRYWLHRRRRTKYSEESESESSGGEADADGHWKSKKIFPARLKLAIEGIEWYIYNRSPAFDIIEENLKNAATSTDSCPSSPDSRHESLHQETSQHSRSINEPANDENLPPQEQDTSSDETNKDYASDSNSSPSSKTQSTKYSKIAALVSHLQSIKEINSNNSNSDNGGSNSNDSDDNSRHVEKSGHSSHPLLTHGDSMILQLLPIDLKFNKGAVIIGNKTTPSLLVFQFASGTGSVDVEKSKNKLDKYKNVYHGHFIKPVIEMKPNIDYEENLELQQEILRMTQKFQFSKLTVLVLSLFSSFRNSFKKFLRKFKSSKQQHCDQNESPASESDHRPWKGLDRYKIDTDAELRELLEKDAALSSGYYPEYARVTTVLDASEGNLTLYYDAPGLVPESPEPDETNGGGLDIGNGGTSPEWGLDLYFKDATIHYGPWTDRQRISIQRLLVPQSCHDATPQSKLLPGDPRAPTEFKVAIKLDKDSIVRIPTREMSKNSQFYAAHAEELRDKENVYIIRPFGWIEITAADMADISYSTAMFPGETSWKTTLQVDITQFEVRTSVNHALLYSAKTLTINSDMSSPLKWNSLQTWVFNCDSYDADCFLMREHIVLLADLMSDFSDGPSTPYDLFTPFVYKFRWNIHNNYKIHLNINDLNIINNPLDLSENIYIIFAGESLDIDVTVPLDQVFQKRNTISFNVSVSSFFLNF